MCQSYDPLCFAAFYNSSHLEDDSRLFITDDKQAGCRQIRLLQSAKRTDLYDYLYHISGEIHIHGKLKSIFLSCSVEKVYNFVTVIAKRLFIEENYTKQNGKQVSFLKAKNQILCLPQTTLLQYLGEIFGYFQNPPN